MCVYVIEGKCERERRECVWEREGSVCEGEREECESERKRESVRVKEWNCRPPTTHVHTTPTTHNIMYYYCI